MSPRLAGVFELEPVQSWPGFLPDNPHSFPDNAEPVLPQTDRRLNETWHKVKLMRDSKAGTIAVYFDDLTKPHMQVSDKTFGKGRIGIGSFDDMNDFDDIQLRGR